MISTEELQRLLDKATKGRRVRFHPDYCDGADNTHYTDCDGSHDTSVIRNDGTRMRGYSSHKHADDAALDALAPELAAEVIRLRAENDRLRELVEPEWFYPADGYDGERCYFSVHEVLEEDYFFGRRKDGQHVVEINVATSLPSIWVAVGFSCNCNDRDKCDCDDNMIVTEHSSNEDARAALETQETPQ